MRIVSIGLYNPIPINSGVDAYVYSLLNPIGKDHDIIHYYYSTIKSQNGRYPDQVHFRTTYIEPKISKKSCSERLPKSMRLARPDLLFDRSFISTITADVVICDDITYPSGRYISKKNKVPLILVKHDILWKKFKSDGSVLYFPISIYENFILKRVNDVITLSMSDYQYVVKQIGSDNVYHIPPLIDSQVYNSHGLRHNFDNDKFNLCFYGSLDRPMNIYALEFIKHDLIPLLEKERLLEKVQINIFGSGVPPKNLQIEKDKNLNYLGVVDNPAVYIRGADLALVPLKNIGGIKIRLLEILSCGKPVLATPEAVMGLPDDIQKMIYVEKDAKGFVKIIKDFLERKMENKIDSTILKKYMEGPTIHDVIEKYIF
jgi:glycosyltransferase involved in cell wall biosynthesis